MHALTLDATVKKRPKATPKAAGGNRKSLAIQVRGTDAWREWAEKVADKDGRSLAAVVERALMAYAKQIGVDDPMPRR